MWTKNNLENLIKENMADYLFVVVSNREPYVHVSKKSRIDCQRGAGGVITALDPVMQACRGLWVAHGSGDADMKAADKYAKVQVPPDNPSYILKRVWLTKEEEKGYYYGYSNSALWPLCHMTFKRPTFEETDWDAYCKVNKKFAKAILEEVGDRKTFVWIQDYHLAMLAKYLKKASPGQFIIAHFWHIPWPNYEVFRLCPQGKDILNGLLANDLLGFHIRYHRDNFLDLIDRELEAKIDREKSSVTRGEHETLVRPYPISVDFEGINKTAQSENINEIMNFFIEEYSLEGMKVLVGLDRIDYTKGIPERIKAVDVLLDKHPELCGKIVFLQMGHISRIHITQYKNLNEELNYLIEQINWKHSTPFWKPIVMVKRYFTFYEILALYRLADVCVVSPLHDGMNLVAKEFVSASVELKGALVLSQFTGAARELEDSAIIINPYDLNGFASGLYKALNLSKKQCAKRLKKMREVIQHNNIYRWAGKILSELLKFEFKED